MARMYDRPTLGPDGWVVDETPTPAPLAWSLDASGNPVGLVGPDGETIGMVQGENGYLFWQEGKFTRSVRAYDEHSSVFRWVLGDAATTISVNASNSTVSHPVDMRGIAYSEATLRLLLTGSGTGKLTVHGSKDGVTNWVSIGDPVTGMVAGTSSYILKLDAAGMVEWDYLRFTVTETGGVNAISIKSVLVAENADTASLPNNHTNNNYVLGDETIGVSVAASGTQESIFCDMRYHKRSSSKIIVNITGTGTAKLTVYGQTMLTDIKHSLGDRITGMTAGTYTLELNDANLAYFPFYSFAVTETGGANAVVATILVAKKTYTKIASKRRVLLLTDSQWVLSANWPTYDDGVADTYAILSRMGYEIEARAVSDVTSTFLDSIGRHYEFAVIAGLFDGFGWSTWTSGSGYAIGRLLKGETPIPVFVASVIASAETKIDGALGTVTQEASAYRKVAWNGKYWYARSCAYTLTTRSHMTAGPTAFITKATDSSNAVAWKFKGANGWVYCDASYNYGGDATLILHMMAEAIADGVIDGPPTKLPVVIDLDDFPDSVNGTQTLQDFERVYSAMSRMNMPATIGIQAGHLSEISSEIVAYVSERVASAGGLFYPIVHSGNWTWTASTKGVADSNYRAEIAACNAKGFIVGSDIDQTNAWNYMYFNHNAFTDETIQLGSPERAMFCSADNGSIKEGYGWKVARSFTIGGLNSNPIGQNARSALGAAYQRGILVVGSFTALDSNIVTMNPDDGSIGTSTMVNMCSRLFTWSAAYLAPSYIHGGNLYNTGGNAPGAVWLEHLADNYEQGLSSVIQFVHGSDLVWFV